MIIEVVDMANVEEIEIEKKGPSQLEKLLEELTEEIRNAKSEEEVKLLEKKSGCC